MNSRSAKMKAHWNDPAYRAKVEAGGAIARGDHWWVVLCGCGAAKICSHCGMGMGTIPCDCNKVLGDGR